MKSLIKHRQKIYWFIFLFPCIAIALGAQYIRIASENDLNNHREEQSIVAIPTYIPTETIAPIPTVDPDPLDLCDEIRDGKCIFLENSVPWTKEQESTFINGCLKEGEDQKLCTCTLEYFQTRYSDEEYIEKLKSTENVSLWETAKAFCYNPAQSQITYRDLPKDNTVPKENIFVPTHTSPTPIPEENTYGSASTYQHIGSTTFGSDGSTYQKIGNTTFGSDGSSYQKIGNSTFVNDGSSYQKIGNTTFGSDGTTYQTIGNTTFGSNGSSCSRIGNSTFCN